MTDFVGRDAVYERLQQHVAKPMTPGAFLLLGRTGIGKSAVLANFDMRFDDAILGVYMPLSIDRLADVGSFVMALAEFTTDLVDQYGFNAERLRSLMETEPDPVQDNVIEAPVTPEIVSDPQTWLKDTYLPVLFRVTRPQRHVVWLWDDADKLLTAISEGALPDDFLVYLRDLLDTFPLLSIVLSLHTRHEETLTQFMPLVSDANTLRLMRLSSWDAAQLLRVRVPGVLETVCEAVYRITGGDPRLVLRFGDYLLQTPQDEIYTETVRQGVPHVYAASQDILRQLWQDLDANERTVLRALAAMHYADPLRSVTAEQIEVWLVDTDTPLDLTTIHSALRSLEYRELVLQGEGGIRLTMELLQRWLLDRAAQQADQDAATGVLVAPRVGRRGWLLLVLAAAAVIVLLVLVSQLPASPSTPLPEPTITLAD